MRIRSHLTLTVLTLLLLSACKAPEQTQTNATYPASVLDSVTQNWNTYTNKNGTFSLKYPPDWTLVADPIATADAVTLFSPGHSPQAMELDVPAIRISTPLVDAGSVTLQPITIHGHAAMDSGWTADEFNGIPHGIRMITITNPSVGISLSAPESLHPLFERIVQSISFKE